MSIFRKQLLFDNQAREKLLKGITVVADAVGSTLGPRSRNVAVDYYHDTDLPPVVLHDGVSVARSINLTDPFEDQGARLVKAAALRTNETAGDGTTTATILAHAIVKEALGNIQAGANQMLLKEEIDLALKQVLTSLKEIAKPVVSDEEIKQVGTISAGSEEIGKLVAEAISKVGKDGVITVEEGNKVETEVEYKQGMEIDRGYLSPYFVNKQETVEAVIEEPYILLTDKKLNYHYDLVPFLEKFLKAKVGKNLVIFAGEVVEEALAVLVVNKVRGNLNVVAVQSPAYGDRRIDELEDLAILTGGVSILTESGRSLDSVEIEELGRADKVIADRDKTIIVNGKGNSGKVKERIEDLKGQIKVANTDFDKQIKQERMAKLSGSIAVINVGAATEVELKEKKERVIDAVNATKAATEEGIVAGGEITLLKISNDLQRLLRASKTAPITLGQDILFEAMKAPFKRLMENSGLDYAEIREKMSGHDYPEGVDVTDGKVKNLIEAGIIDPVKVTRSALENAVSVASMVITTNCLIVDAPKEES